MYLGNNKAILAKYFQLPQPANKVQLMYLWIDGSGQHMRGKSMTVNKEPESYTDCPVWNFDGSSTEQATGANSDVYLEPVALYQDPFRGGNNKLVLCETYDQDNKPLSSNKRYQCRMLMEQAKDTHPWFGIEQEYTLLDIDSHPLGWPKDGYPAPQGQYYCGVGAGRAIGRDIIEAHYRACLYTGITISGTNAEVMPSQWEFQVGPCEGIKMGDELWLARYLLLRVAEDFGVRVTFDPKPILGDWNGSGAHTNFSTAAMRGKNGINHIYDAIKKLEQYHGEHLKLYDPTQGRDNKRRLTGVHETASYRSFSYGVASRSSSIRIPRHVERSNCGYLEDRRPAANCDPYSVTAAIVSTTILGQPPQGL
jgi:glutamine synthetase